MSRRAFAVVFGLLAVVAAGAVWYISSPRAPASESDHGSPGANSDWSSNRASARRRIRAGSSGRASSRDLASACPSHGCTKGAGAC